VINRLSRRESQDPVVRCWLFFLCALWTLEAPADDSGWSLHGQSFFEQRLSPLTQINPQSVKDLGLAWFFDTGTRRGLEASPIVVDGIIYTTGSWSRVYALDGKSGALIWSFDPEVPRAWGANACCDVVNRGVAVLGDQVFVGTIDGRLIALDRTQGDVLWSTLTIDPGKPYTITGAPRLVGDLVIIGNGGAEYGVRGYVSAYEAATGALKWRFYTVPGNPAQPQESAALERAVKTWTGDEFWRFGGGGTVWDSMAYDPDLDLLYIGVGNGSPWNRDIRSPEGGDNLYLSSIVALEGSTGEYRWHYQTTPADNWDYTATQHMILAELLIEGVPRQVIMQAPKNGFFYVLDRMTGELLSAEAYVPVNWASEVDPETGRPVETDVASYRDKDQLVRPAPFGAHNWQPMAWNPDSGLVYIPAMENFSLYSNPADYNHQDGPHWNTGQNDGAIQDNPLASIDPLYAAPLLKHLMRGQLIAWDPRKGRAAWRQSLPSMWNGGVLTTASGLVFQGQGSGELVAFGAHSGERLWSTDAQSGIIAPPVSYEIEGEQYLAVMAGWGGAIGLVLAQPSVKQGAPGRLLVYKIGGKAALPVEAPQELVLDPPPDTASDSEIASGLALYNQHCMRCHGLGAVSQGLVPDLRAMSKTTHEIFDAIVLDGVLAPVGMIGFKSVMTEQDSEHVRRYLIRAAHDQVALQEESLQWRGVRDWFLDQLGWLAAKVL
jgi:quinohemoprotein ethanol dehydrogenase